MTTNKNTQRLAPKAATGAPKARSHELEVVAARAHLSAGVLQPQSLGLPEGLSYDDWAGYGAVIGSLVHNATWWLGDWWRFGKRRYGEAKANAAVTGFSLQSVKAAAWVAGKFDEPSRRRDDVTFSHHREVARLAEKEADKLLAKAAAKKWTTKALRREVRRRRTTAKLGVATRRAAADLKTMGTFAVILADPPWRYDDAEPSRAVENHYDSLDVATICALPVRAAADAVLFLWVPASLLQTGLDVVTAWGFRYKTNFIWKKDRIGMGHYSRLQHEHLYVATRGNLAVPPEAQRSASVFDAPRSAHSVKPKEAYDIIERAYPKLTKVELFARFARPGWEPWGKQAPKPS